MMPQESKISNFCKVHSHQLQFAPTAHTILKICSISSFQQDAVHLRSTVPIFTLILWLCLCKCFQVMFNQVCQFVQDLRSFQWTFWGPNWEGSFGSFDSSFHLKMQETVTINVGLRKNIKQSADELIFERLIIQITLLGLPHLFRVVAIDSFSICTFSRHYLITQDSFFSWYSISQ